VAGQAKPKPKGCDANVPGRGRQLRAMCRCRARLNQVKGGFRRTRRCAIADVSHSWSPYKVSCGQVTVGGTNTGGGRLSRADFERQLDDPWYNTEIVSGRLTRTHFFRCAWQNPNCDDTCRSTETSIAKLKDAEPDSVSAVPV
jgi:hypothetical protein